MSSLTPIELSDKDGASEFRAAPMEGVLRSTARYLLRTEVHTFAFSVAANATLSFFPFLLLLMTLIRYVFHSRVMYGVVENLLRGLAPSWGRWLPFNGSRFFIDGHSAVALGSSGLSWWAGGIVFALFLIAAVVGGTVMLRRTDVA